ncbi:DUF305 domain-containing protein [Millisia brevis]|uniref:DUF305 domain-containing protein n=1 Tax=Millisia brevis TaxID=264148 RepID=UPI000AC4EFCB|nr:DUF305 domain-containing protein [Millisia brevis]
MSNPTVTEAPEPASPDADVEVPPPGRVRPSTLVIGGLIVLVAGILLGWFVRPMTESGTTLDIPAADSVDVGFAQDMTVHHSQATEMAAVELANGTDARVRGVAYDILTSQQNQIGQMQGWLALWGRSPAPVDGYMRWMDHSDSGMAGMDHSGGHTDGTATDDDASAGSTTMPGMATPEQLAQLRAATGVDVDRIFLDLMMTHHQGGVAMMQQAQERAESPVVRRLAESMLQTQTSELDLMASLRSQLG